MKTNQPRTAPVGARRRLLKCATLTAAAALTAPLEAADKASRKLAKSPLAVGDILAFPSWEEDGRLLTADDLIIDAPPLLVYPQDRASGVTRERSRLNQILVMRFDPELLDDTLTSRAVDGILAYSGVCTHTACGVSEWEASQRHLVCPCHGSTFDPLKNGQRVSGPAPRGLPWIGLEQDKQHFVINSEFSAKAGART